MTDKLSLRYGIMKKFGAFHTVDETNVMPLTEELTYKQWYRYAPRRTLRSGYYMISLKGSHDVLGHDFCIRTSDSAKFHLQIGSRVYSKRLIYLSERTGHLDICIAPGTGTSEPVRFTLTRVTKKFAHSRLTKKIKYSSGYNSILDRAKFLEKKEKYQSREIFYSQYNRLLERHINKLQYSEWLEIQKLNSDNNWSAISDDGTYSDRSVSIALVCPDKDVQLSKIIGEIESLKKSTSEEIVVILNTAESTSKLESIVGSESVINGKGTADCAQFDKMVNDIGTEYMFFVGEGVVPVKGAFIRLIDQALSERELSLIYSDSDVLQGTERSSPSFKPEWNLDMLLSGNYIGRFFLLKTEKMKSIDGLQSEFENSMEYDVLLRLTTKLQLFEVGRVPEILFGRTDADALEMPYISRGTHDTPALSNYLEKEDIKASIEDGILDGTVRLDWHLQTPNPSVDIIIPTRDRVDLLRVCIDSILSKTEYENFRITVVDNNSVETETEEYYKEILKNPICNMVRFDGEFNYSAINNYAVSTTSGDVVVLLNNDTEVIHGSWLKRLAALSMRPYTGCVGAKLYYSSGLIQHAGVILGVRGVAGHSHRFADREEDGYCGRLKMPQNVSAVTAACLAVRREVYEKVNGLDELNLKVAYNDVDFCLRVSEAGYTNTWTPYVELYHHESLSRGSDDTSAKAQRFQFEYDYMLERWNTHQIVDPAYNPNLALDIEDFSLAA